MFSYYYHNDDIIIIIIIIITDHWALLSINTLQFLTPAHTILTFLGLRCHVLWVATLVKADP